jgi:hypothetical protein
MKSDARDGDSAFTGRPLTPCADTISAPEGPAGDMAGEDDVVEDMQCTLARRFHGLVVG